jgi:hypothetical protein
MENWLGGEALGTAPNVADIIGISCPRRSAHLGRRVAFLANPRSRTGAK